MLINNRDLHGENTDEDKYVHMKISFPISEKTQHYFIYSHVKKDTVVLLYVSGHNKKNLLFLGRS